MKSERLLKVALLAGALWAFVPAAFGAEVITSFHSDVSVQTDGSVCVSETIDVTAEGKSIQRGIFRDFPTVYEDRSGKKIRIPFRVLSVTRDGQEEPWTLEDTEDGVRIRMGSGDRLLSMGEHRYVLSYRTDRQVGFFRDYDELYWNATGNDWEFTINRASCRVELPEGAEVLQSGVWTGYRGSDARDADIIRESSSDICFRSAGPLKPGQGMTVAVSWPKGVVTPPPGSPYFLWDHGAEITYSAAALAELLILLWAWFKVGKDPARGNVIPRFSPPKGVSPAAARKILIADFDDKNFSSAIVSLAVKGYLTISEEKSFLSKKYRLRRVKSGEKLPLAREEERLYSVLMKPYSSLLLNSKNCEAIGGARDALKDSLDADYGNLYSDNLWYVAAAMAVMVLLVGLGTFFMGWGDLLAVMVTTFMTLFSVAVVWFFVRKIIKTFRRKRGFLALISTGVHILLAMSGLLLFFCMVTGVAAQGAIYTGGALAAMAAAAVLPAVFAPLMHSRTARCRALLDEIEGFAMYLKVAEEDRLGMLTPPEKTPELFEKYLPYAIALDLEQAWGDKFARALAVGDGKGAEYAPRWYSGTDPLYVSSMGKFASNLGSSFKSAVSGAAAGSAKAPGSSSAFSGGGGGVSGGGGGGGGGGGW